MAHKGNKITAPVELEADVCAVLGLSRIDTGYACGNSHGLIKPWAKYKPVEAPIPEWDVHKRYEERSVNGSLRWMETTTGGVAGYRGARGDCGLSVSVINAVNMAGQSSAEWKYEPPRTFFRLTDFDGYNHAAKAPYRGITVTGETVTTLLVGGEQKAVSVYGGQTVDIALLPSTGDDSVLKLSDISINGMSGSDSETLGQAWAGVVVYTAASLTPADYLCFLTADSQGGMTPIRWELPSRSIGSSLWLVPVLAKNRQRYKNDNGSLATLVQNSLVRVPGAPVVKLTYTSKEVAAGLELTLTARELSAVGDASGASRVTATLTVKATGRTYTGGGYFTLYSNGKQVASEDIADFTIAAGEKKTILGAFDSRVWGGGLTVDVHLDGGYSVTGVVPMKTGGTVVT